MKSFNKSVLSSVLIAGSIFLFAACNSGNAKDSVAVKAGQETSAPKSSDVAVTQPIQPQLDKAKADGKVVLLVLTSKDHAKNQKTNDLAQSVHGKVEQSVVINMDRDDAANAQIVKDWQLDGIITPAIFVVSYKGLPVSGYSLDDAKESDIIEAIPSPKTDEAYAAINESKSVFLVVTEASFADRDQVLGNCQSASSLLKTKPAIIEVNKSDAREKSLLTNYKIDANTKTTTVVVINESGQTTDTYNGPVASGKLVASAKKVVKSACCASGSSCK